MIRTSLDGFTFVNMESLHSTNYGPHHIIRFLYLSWFFFLHFNSPFLYTGWLIILKFNHKYLGINATSHHVFQGHILRLQYGSYKVINLFYFTFLHMISEDLLYSVVWWVSSCSLFCPSVTSANLNRISALISPSLSIHTRFPSNSPSHRLYIMSQDLLRELEREAHLEHLAEHGMSASDTSEMCTTSYSGTPQPPPLVLNHFTISSTGTSQPPPLVLHNLLNHSFTTSFTGTS